MKVYVVLPWIVYEGFDSPIGVFASRDLAEKAIAAQKNDWIRRYEIQEFVVQDDGW